MFIKSANYIVAVDLYNNTIHMIFLPVRSIVFQLQDSNVMFYMYIYTNTEHKNSWFVTTRLLQS